MMNIYVLTVGLISKILPASHTSVGTAEPLTVDFYSQLYSRYVSVVLCRKKLVQFTFNLAQPVAPETR